MPTLLNILLRQWKHCYADSFMLKVILVFLLFIVFFIINLISAELSEIISPLILVSILYSSIYLYEIVIIIEDKELFLVTEKIYFFFLVGTLSIIFLIGYILYLRPMLRNSYIWALEKLVNIFFLNCIIVLSYTLIYFGFYYFTKLFEVKEKMKDYVHLNLTLEGFVFYLYDFKIIHYLYIIGIIISFFSLFIIKKYLLIYIRGFIVLILNLIVPLGLFSLNIKIENLMYIILFSWLVEVIILLKGVSDFDFFKCKK